MYGVIFGRKQDSPLTWVGGNWIPEEEGALILWKEDGIIWAIQDENDCLILEWRGPGQALPGGAIPLASFPGTSLVIEQDDVNVWLDGISPGWDIPHFEDIDLYEVIRKIATDGLSQSGTFVNWRWQGGHNTWRSLTDG